MAKPERIDALVLGSGEGGKYLAWHLARSGQRAVVVERRWIGGSCPNINCLPSKNEIWSAKVADLARRAGNFGAMTGPVTIDMAKVRQRKRDMVDGLIAMHLQNYKDSGAELIMGSGRFVAPKTIEVQLNEGGTRLLAGEQVFLNVGTSPAIPDVPGLAAAQPLTNIKALDLDYPPSHLIVLGGGYVGLELAQAYRRFGSRVTIVEYGPQLAGREDADVAEEIRRILGDDGIDILVSAKTLRVEGQSGQRVVLRVLTASGERTIEGSDILVAAGRRPNTAGIGLDIAGVALDDRGYIKVNERLETSTSSTWAIGECAGSPPVHPCVARRFPHHPRQSRRTRAHHTRALGSVLHVHGPTTRAGRAERSRGATPGRPGACGEDTDKRRVADANDRREERLHEGARRCG